MNLSPHTQARIIHQLAKAQNVGCRVDVENDNLIITFSVYYAGEWETRRAKILPHQTEDVLSKLVWNDSPRHVFSQYIDTSDQVRKIE